METESSSFYFFEATGNKEGELEDEEKVREELLD